MDNLGGRDVGRFGGGGGGGGGGGVDLLFRLFTEVVVSY